MRPFRPYDKCCSKWEEVRNPFMPSMIGNLIRYKFALFVDSSLYMSSLLDLDINMEHLICFITFFSLGSVIYLGGDADQVWEKGYWVTWTVNSSYNSAHASFTWRVTHNIYIGWSGPNFNVEWYKNGKLGSYQETGSVEVQQCSPTSP